MVIGLSDGARFINTRTVEQVHDCGEGMILVYTTAGLSIRLRGEEAREFMEIYSSLMGVVDIEKLRKATVISS